jgi:hypothetical protein
MRRHARAAVTTFSVASALAVSSAAAAQVAEEAPREEPADEVTVRGTRQRADESAISRAEARNLPGAFGDPLRAIDAQPGLSPLISGLPYLFLRGAPPGNVGYFVDGIPIPVLYHAFAGPAVLHPALVDHVDIHRGAYPARYGRFMGGVVEANTADIGEHFTAEGRLGLLDAGALVAAPFAGDAGRIAIAGRYSLTAATLSPYVLDDTRLEYWDYQARASYDLGRDDTIRVFGFGARDVFATESEGTLSSTEFHRLSASYEHRVAAASNLRLRATLGLDRTQATTESTLTARSLRAELEVDHSLSLDASLTTGADVVIERRKPHFDDLRAFDELVPGGDYLTWGVFGEMTLAPDPAVTLIPGLRLDVFRNPQGTDLVGIDPRVTAIFGVSQSLSVSHSLGLSHQRPSSLPPIFPGFEQTSQAGGLQRSVQASSGVTLELPEDVRASATVFDTIFLDMTDPVGTTGEFDLNTFDGRTQGNTVGLEVSIERKLTRRLGGFLAYTLSRSTRSHGQIHSVSAFDRTHVANFALSYDFGAGWRAGGRVFAMSGVPTRHPTTEGPTFDGSDRAPGFVRVDARVEKRWMLSQTAYIAVIGEVLNATASQETVSRSCNPVRCTESVFGPLVLPNVAVEAKY